MAFLSEHVLDGASVSIVVVPELEGIGSMVVAHEFSCSMVCGNFPDRGCNLCLLYWQADSLPLNHQGSSLCFLVEVGKSFIHYGYKILWIYDLQILSPNLWFIFLSC